MSVVKVYSNGLDWLTSCATHDDLTWCGDWEAAMEAAWGHIAMWHGAPR